MKHSLPLHIAIPSHKYRMRFIAASALITSIDELFLEPMRPPISAQQSTVEWAKSRNRLESPQSK